MLVSNTHAKGWKKSVRIAVWMLWYMSTVHHLIHLCVTVFSHLDASVSMLYACTLTQKIASKTIKILRASLATECWRVSFHLIWPTAESHIKTASEYLGWYRQNRACLLRALDGRCWQLLHAFKDIWHNGCIKKSQEIADTLPYTIAGSSALECHYHKEVRKLEFIHINSSVCFLQVLQSWLHMYVQTGKHWWALKS